MQNIKIVGRHLKITDGISNYVKKRLGGLDKYVHNIVSIQVILEVEKYRHSVEVILHTSKKVFKIKETDEDLYVAIDKSENRLKDLLIRYKEKIIYEKKHRKKTSELFDGVEKDYNYTTKFVRVDKMSLDKAMEMLKSENKDLLVFYNVETNKINLLKNIENNIEVLVLENANSVK